MVSDLASARYRGRAIMIVRSVMCGHDRLQPAATMYVEVLESRSIPTMGCW